MHLDARASFLVVHDDLNTPQLKLSFVSSLGEALQGWTKASRLSPVWRISRDGAASVDYQLPDKEACITFIGPARPAKLLSEVEAIFSASGIWASLGCFNIVVATACDESGVALAKRLVAWAQVNEVAFEQWKILEGHVIDAHHFVLAGRSSPVVSKMASYAKHFRHPALRSSFEENLVASATALSRASAVYPQIYDELEAAIKSTADMMALHSKDLVNLHDMQSRLLTMNAALSRFSSQAFSGIPPILNTECHFWIHSFLGTGSANIALASLVASVQQVLGEARIRERLVALNNIRSNVPQSGELLSDPKLLDFDILTATAIDSPTERPVVPLVTYFSGRDGFSSHVNTLSAPLTTLAECTSLRSNLLTVTHEISHVVIQSVLAEISPTPGVREDMHEALALLKPKAVSQTWLGSAKLLLLEAMVSMAIEDREGQRVYEINELLESEITSLVETLRLEVQEIMVHTFDFLYFHSSEPKYYITNIWHSWCAIPGIRDRVPDYLLRTLCAVSSTLLKNAPRTRFDAALREVKQELDLIKDKVGFERNYVNDALNYISELEADRDLYEKFMKRYSVRMRLVRLVYIFLFSSSLAASLFHDPYVGGGEGYRVKKALTYDLYPVGNALQFLRIYLKAAPSEAESMWVLHALAFDLTPSPLEAR